MTAETRVIDPADVAAALARAWDDSSTQLLDYTIELVPGTSPTRGGVYRLRGAAHLRGLEQPWRLVLKVLRPLDDAFVANIRARTPEHVDEVVAAVRWDREALAYQSGLLSDLPPGLAAARCYRIEERPADGIWLWLEDVDDGHGRWTLGDFAQAAEHVGRFNGAYLVDHPLPTQAWLSQDSLSPFLRLLTAEGRAAVTDRSKWESTLAREVFPEPPLDRLTRLSDDFDVFHQAVRRLPRTFCHHDPHQDNLFFRGDGMAAIDWQMCGIGAVGEDIGQLVGYCLKSYTVRGEHAADLDRAAFDGYLRGLRRAGWQGDQRLARLGYLATLAPRHALQVPQLNMLADTSRHAAIERRRDMPMLEIARHHAAVTHFLLDRADEARALIAHQP